MGRQWLYHWSESNGKTCKFCSTVSLAVTDDIKINEHNNQLAKGPLYVQSDLSIPAESGFEPFGISGEVAI